MARTKLREKCTYVKGVRDPVLTSEIRWSNVNEIPPGYTLGIENSPFARRERNNAEGRSDLKRYDSIDKDEVKKRNPNLDAWLSRNNTPYSDSIRPFKQKD